MIENIPLPFINGFGNANQFTGNEAVFINTLRDNFDNRTRSVPALNGVNQSAGFSYTVTNDGIEDGSIIQLFGTALSEFGILAEHLISNDYRLVTVSELMTIRQITPEAGKHYDNFHIKPADIEYPDFQPGVWHNIVPRPETIYPPGNIPLNQLGTQGMTVCPTDPDVLYLSVGPVPNSLREWQGIWKSKDRGNSWHRIQGSGCPGKILVNPYNSNHLYHDESVRHYMRGFLSSLDGGLTWTRSEGFGVATFSNDVYHTQMSPSDPNHILLANRGGHQGILESFNGGFTWTGHTYPSEAQDFNGKSVYFLYDPRTGQGNDRTWLLATDARGHWKTSDGGATWTRVTTNNMVHGTGGYHYARNGAVYVSGHQHSNVTGPSTGGLMRSFDNGDTWQVVLGGESYDINSDGNLLYVWLHSNNLIYTSPEDQGGPGQWTAHPMVQGSGHGAWSIHFDPINRIMYTSNGNGSSLDQRGTWALKVAQPLERVDIEEITPTDTHIHLDSRREYGKIEIGTVPAYANTMNLVWTSTNSSIVAVDQNGFVTAVAPNGTADITVRDTVSGKQAVAKVTVGTGIFEPPTRTMTTVITPGGMFPEGADITLRAESNVGYEFIGWYHEGKEISDILSTEIKVGTETIVYEARFRQLTVDN
jgi:hypothetical protein